jgi:hypothetical protein
MLGLSVGLFFAAPGFGISPVYFMFSAVGVAGLMLVESIAEADAGRRHSITVPDV